MTSTTPAAIADIIGRVKRPEKTVSICLAGDLQAEFEDLERDLQIARDQPADGTLAGGANPMATQIAQQIMELRERMREHTTVFKFRGLPRKEYSDLVAACPPSDEEREKGADVDWELFPVQLVAACCVSHQMTPEEAGLLADELTDAQWESLYVAAFAVNKRAVDVPFSFAASAILQTSRKSSK
ncbi:hypothetical protein ACFYUV_20535 [Nonomuraea sp. NPDC003560]|uniref:hypothetical protein n=1 Tax=Nonomuraea sp. NPDC003560 TaxID=3364341 RepID=UPI00367A3405